MSFEKINASEDLDQSAMNDSLRAFQRFSQIPLKHSVMNSIDQSEITSMSIAATKEV